MAGYTLNRILVAIADPFAGLDKAVRRARGLAHRTGATVDLFNAIRSSVSTGTLHAESEQFTRLEAGQHRRLLERTANRLRREEIIVNTKVDTGYPVHEAILHEVDRTKADLLVIEARRHSLFARLLLTQTDFELIRHCPVPLLIVKRKAAWRRPRILAALDPFHIHDKPSGLDGEIVAAARAIAESVGGSVHAAHIYRPLPEGDKRYEATVRRRFYEAVDGYGIAKSKAHLLCGDPTVALPLLARSTRAGLMVMGATSRSGLKRIFIGNTAERVLDGLQCDVLVVKPRR